MLASHVRDCCTLDFLSIRRLVDLSGVTAIDQAATIGRSELEGLPDDAAVAIIGVQGARGV